MTRQGKYSTCSQNMYVCIYVYNSGKHNTYYRLVRNATVHYGVGMSIGSVPPSIHHNCIKDVTFQDITYSEPIKAIYVKTNPGDYGLYQFKPSGSNY